MEKTVETFKLKHIGLEYKINEEKGVVTAIEKFQAGLLFRTKKTFVGVAKLNKEKGDVFDVEKGKKLARAKAEKEAFSWFKGEIKRLLKSNSVFRNKLDATLLKFNEYIEHQKEYIKTF